MKRKYQLPLLVASALTFSLFLSPHALAGTVTSPDLDPLLVTALKAKTVGDKVRETVSLGVLGDAKSIEIPLTVSSFNQKAINMVKQPGNTLTQVATLDPNVTSSGGSTYNDLRIRGFYVSPHDYYLNGISGMLSQSSIPMNFVDRVEVISGPSTLLYGIPANGSIGGAINLVSKKADAVSKITFTETYSSKHNFEHAVDINHRFGDNFEWGIRTNIDYADGATEFDNEKMMRKNAFINLDYKTQTDSINLLYGYRHVDQTAPNFYLSLNEHPLPEAPDGSANFQLPWSRYSYKNNIVTFNATHKLSNEWTAFLNAGYHDEDWYNCIDSYYPELVDDKGTFAAQAENVPIRFWRLAVSTGLQGKVKTEKVTHNISLAFDRLSSNGRGQDWFDDGNDSWFYGNIYDNSMSKNTTMRNIKLDPWYYSGALIAYGVSLADRITTNDGKWIFLAGSRYQTVKAFSKHDGKVYTQKGTSSAFSPSFGVMYNLNETTALYANYIAGFSKGMFVHSRYKNAGEYLPPQKSYQREVGVKWQTEDNRIGGSASVFDLTQDNAYAVNDVFSYHGHQKNKGFHAMVYGYVTPKLDIIAGLTYLTGTIKGGDTDGKELTSVPKWNVTLNANYEITEDWSVHSRLTYASSALLRYGTDKVPSASTPAWTRVDVGTTYYHPIGDNRYITFDLNIYNVFNKRYWVARGQDTVGLDGPRSVVLSASYEF